MNYGQDAPAPIVDDSPIPPSMDIANYSFAQFETDMANFRPRAFDTYVLPAFTMYFAWKAKGMGRLARRMLFVAGIYMAYRSYNEYKNLVVAAKQYIQSKGAGANNYSPVL
jgi:hypothetical protein